MKNYTFIEHSKKLTEILPLESSDIIIYMICLSFLFVLIAYVIMKMINHITDYTTEDLDKEMQKEDEKVYK